MNNPRIWCLSLLIFTLFGAHLAAQIRCHIWEVQEIAFQTEGDYANPYSDVLMWIDLTGPDFSKRIYGFWDGTTTFRVRFVATGPGEWKWKSGSNQPADIGLNEKSGTLIAVDWTNAEKRANPNRRGFVKPTANGHALQYADGTPFFMVGDTWWAASTWRLPFKGIEPNPHYEPGPGIGFEELIQFRKRQGYNSINMIASYPNWSADHRSRSHKDSNGVRIRSGWPKWGHYSSNGDLTVKDMHDENGNRPFEMLADGDGVANFDRINPAYFRNLDRKMFYLSGQGFVPFLETIRRDHGPSWNAYFDFQTSFARHVNYLVARYGALNLIFSGIHLDAIPRDASLTAEDFNAALTYYLSKYGGLPYGQPFTTLISFSTLSRFGHADECPWLSFHSVGNRGARNHGISDELAKIFDLDPPYPVANLEPYYTGWDGGANRPAGERPPENSVRDNYFARASMYGSVLSGALSGHAHGHSGYACTTTGEPAGDHPYIWQALVFDSGNYAPFLKKFILSEGARYQELQPVRGDLQPSQAPNSSDEGLDGWGFLLRNEAKDLVFLYFENEAPRPAILHLNVRSRYRLVWFDPRKGEWLDHQYLNSDENGRLQMPEFPGGKEKATSDWAAKLTMVK